MSVALVCLPALLFVAWYLGAGYTRFDRYRRASGEERVLTAELLQLFVHDELHRHLRRLSLPASPQSLPVVELSITAGGMKSLEEDVRGTGKRTYVKARLRKDGQMHKVRVRLQGRRHWHHIGVQKSFKVRAAKGDLVDGLRTFNLVNDVTPFGLEEQIVLDVAKSLGLLTPDYLPVRLRLNNTDLGVYRLVGTPDEGLLRRAGRMPGSIYSGRFDRPCDPKATPKDPEKPCGFAKLAGRDKEDRTRFGEILGLHHALHEASPEDWRSYAQQRLDLERFARFEALDVVFGGDQHDEGANFKLYYDPYRGWFEPIAMDFRAFRHDQRVNLASNHLQRKLHAVPEYMRLRNQWIHRLATGEGAPATVRARVDTWFGALRAELESDPYWDAYKLLPKATSFHRLMVRPMTVSRWLTASRKELDTHAQRHRYLRDVLDEARLEATVQTTTAGMSLHLEVQGLGAYALEELQALGLGPEQACGLPEGLPVVQARVQARVQNRAVGSGLRAQPVATRVRVKLACSGPVESLWLTVKNVVTGRSHRLRVEPGVAAGPALALQPGQGGGDQTVTLGPGIVSVPSDRHFGAGTHVQILAGTTLQMGPGVSLTFEGRVSAPGTSRAPIRVMRAKADSAYGGVRIFGPATAGTSLRHVHFTGGSSAEHPERYVPGFMAIYDTSRIELSHLRFFDIENAEDVLHITYVQDLTVDDVIVRAAPVDAIDLEMVQGRLRGLRVHQAGDECLDLMGAKIEVTDSVLVGCANNAVSAGEDSAVTLDGLLIARSKVAVLAKNASNVWLSRSVVFEAKHALRTNKKDVHYQRPSRLEAEMLFVHGVQDLKKRGRGTHMSLLRSVRGLPQEGQLRSLRSDVLSIASWREPVVTAYVEEALR